MSLTFNINAGETQTCVAPENTVFTNIINAYWGSGNNNECSYPGGVIIGTAGSYDDFTFITVQLPANSIVIEAIDANFNNCNPTATRLQIQLAYTNNTPTNFLVKSGTVHVDLETIFQGAQDGSNNPTFTTYSTQYPSFSNGLNFAKAKTSWNNETVNGRDATSYIPSTFDSQNNVGYIENGTDVGSVYIAPYVDYLQPGPNATQQWTGTFEPWVDEIYVIAQGQGGYGNTIHIGDDKNFSSNSGGNGGMIGWSHTGVANMEYTVTITGGHAQLYLANGNYCIAYQGGNAGAVYGGDDDIQGLNTPGPGGGSNHVGGTVQFYINGLSGGPNLYPYNNRVNDPGPSYANWINTWKDRGHAQYWSHGSNPQPEPGAVRIYKKALEPTD